MSTERRSSTSDDDTALPVPLTLFTGVAVVGACLLVGGMLVGVGETFRSAVAPFRQARHDAADLTAPAASPDVAAPRDH